MGKLTGKVAVVTGAAVGIGAAAVKRFLEEDAEAVALIDINFEAVKATARELDPTGTRAFPFQCNLADYADNERCFKEIMEKLGRVDVLVNNAGITRDRTIIKMSLEEWHAVLDVDLTALFYCCKQVAPGMIERKYGKIVNMSSIGFGGAHGQANYAAAKYGVLGLTRMLAKELAQYNITANAICPAGVNTVMFNSLPEEARAAKLAKFPRHRAAETSEVAAVITFLASDDSSFVNGEKIVVTDGRMTN